jgi:hypothetical protein
MEKFNFYNRRQDLIGIIVVLAIVVLIGGGLYYYRSKQTQKVLQIPQKQVEEVKLKEATPPEKPKVEEETKNLEGEKKEGESYIPYILLEIENEETKNWEGEEGESYIPLEIANSEYKLWRYLYDLYCGIGCCGLTNEVYKKKLVKNYPEFYISECGAGGTCNAGGKMRIYFVEKGTGLVKIVWEENTYGSGSNESIAALKKSNVEFKDLDNDGNLEIIQNVVEMKCKRQEGCCWAEECCENGEIISKREYQKIFRWDEGNRKFVEISMD